MKVSLNEIKRLGYEDIVSLPVDELVEKIGAQLGAVEDVEDLGAKYRDVIVARVVSCERHPDADRLNVCKIDDGGVVEHMERDANGLIQVVCGAPNVHEDMFVAWLPPGATVPETYHHEAPFVLEARELRGVVSNGMLASAKELALSDDHEGILEIDVDAKPGESFAKLYHLDDHIIDIENKMFTHRPDCFGLLGVARELAGIQQKSFTSPEWYLEPSFEDGEGLDLNVVNEVPELVPRFVAVAMKNIKVVPSPMWLQSALLRLGSRPINNVVDITNYVMLITGQPLHAYDYDKVSSGTLGARLARPNEKIKLLSGKAIVPTKSDIVITDGEKPIGLGGVMGGADTEVDDSTTNIILECANFDMYAIRRTSMRHGLFTDAVTRFNKGQSPLQNTTAVAKAMEMFASIAQGKVASPVTDDNQLPAETLEWSAVHSPVKVNTTFINARLGLELMPEEVKKLLENVEFTVSNPPDGLLIEAPFWRTDIKIPEDIVEEVGRLYGYDRLPLGLPKRDITPADRNELLDLKSKVREILSRSGANEVLTYSFVHGDLLNKVGQNKELAFQISNALSPDLQYYRLSVLPSLLDKVHANIKSGHDEFALFEIGRGHNLQHATDDVGLPREFEMLDLVYAANDKIARPGAAYYQARSFLDELMYKLGLEIEYRAVEREIDQPIAAPFDHTRSAFVFVKNTDTILGMVGELKTNVRKTLKLPIHTAAFSVGLPELLNATAGLASNYAPLSRYPGTSQDITIRVESDTRFASVASVIERVLGEFDLQTSLEPIGIYQPEQNSAKNLTYRIKLTDLNQTITTQAANDIVEKITRTLKEDIPSAEIV